MKLNLFCSNPQKTRTCKYRLWIHEIPAHYASQASTYIHEFYTERTYTDVREWVINWTGLFVLERRRVWLTCTVTVSRVLHQSTWPSGGQVFNTTYSKFWEKYIERRVTDISLHPQINLSATNKFTRIISNKGARCCIHSCTSLARNVSPLF